MNGKSWIGPALGILLLFIFLLLPPIAPVTAMGMKTIGVFLFTLVWWVTVGTSYPSLLCIVLLAICGLMTATEAFALSLGNYMILFIIGAMGMAECLRIQGFSKRFALWFLSRRFTAGHPWRLLSMLLLSCCLMGSFVESISVYIIFVAVAVPMLETLGCKKGDEFAATVIMGLAWISVTSLIMTPISHGTNLIFIEWVKRDMNFTLSLPKWFAVGFPTGFLYALIILAYFRFVVRPDVSRFGTQAVEYVRQEREKQGPMKLEEKITLGVFLLAVVFWLLPDLAKGLLPGVSAYVGKLTFAVPAIVGASLLCIIRVKDKPLLTYSQWMEGVDWPTVALCGAIMAIKGPIESPGTGIPQLLNSIFHPLATGVSPILYRLIGVLWVIIITQFMSNTVSCTLVYTAMMPAALAAGLGNQVALGFALWCGARAAFALPSATTCCAMATGSGWVPVGFMAKHGFPLIIPMAPFVTFVCYGIGSAVFR